MISGLFTLASFIAFAGVCYWAFSKHNHQRFDEASRLPFEDDVLPGDKS